MTTQEPAVPERDGGLLRVRLDIAYDGSPFSGWALQPGLVTVQGVLEDALFTLLRRPVRLTVGGRTDAGVHARGQVAHADLTAGEWTGMGRGREVDPADAFRRRLTGTINRVLTDGSGQSAQARFDRDVLAQPDVSTVVVMEGVNDLRWDLATTPADLIGPYRQLVARAHARGVCVVGGTITPWEGGSRWSPAKDDVREAVNAWIRGSGELDAVVLARAGLARLGRLDEATEVIDPLTMLPAPAQGALALECRAEDVDLVELLAKLDDPDTRTAVAAERALLGALEAGCTAPVGALAEIAEGDDGTEIFLRGLVSALDGSDTVRLSATGPTHTAQEVGRRLAAELLDLGAGELMGSLMGDTR